MSDFVSKMGSLADSPVPLLLLVLTVIAAAYYFAVTAVAAAWLFRNRRDSADADYSPPISILKPLNGAGSELLENLRAHALQDYPEFELLFGVADADDPAVEVVRRLAREFPKRRIEVFVCDCAAEGNAKVQRLERLAREARFDTLLVNDADIRVDSSYLRRVVQPLSDPSVGLVTCLFRARPRGGFASLLEALWVSAEFQGQVLLARAIQGTRFALGATLALRRRELNRVGGFESLRPYLADDNVLGTRITDLGMRVVVSPYVVETLLAAESWRDVWLQLLRWARTVRVSRPVGYAGLAVTHGTLWSLCALVHAMAFPQLAGETLAAGAALCVLLRLAAAWAVGVGVIGSNAVRARLYLLPVADLLGFAVWSASFFGNRVYWAGRWLRVDRRGRMRADAARRPASR